MKQRATGRRRGVRLLIIGLALIVIGLSIPLVLLALPGSDPGDNPNPGNPGQPAGGGGTDFAGIALVVTSLGGLITGLITAVTGLILALRKPNTVADGGTTLGGSPPAPLT
jgi:hypothetical protein